MKSYVALSLVLGSSGAYGDITSLTLTAGDWDVTGILAAAGVATYIGVGISTTSGNSSAGLSEGDTLVYCVGPTASNNQDATIPNVRFSLASTTTVYLKVTSGYPAGSPTFGGRISARRMR